MKHFKFSYVLITLAALAQGVMWVNVFKLLHPGILAYIGGVPAGLAIVGLVARSATVLPRVTSKRARTAGWMFLGLLVVTEPIVLGFANWQAIYPQFQSLAVSYVVSGGASLTISIALILGAIVDRSLVPVEKPVAKVAEVAGKPSRNKKKVARQPISDAVLESYFAGNPGATDTQVAAHFGVTRQAIGKRRKKLYSVGVER
jgi:hypothetical protein